METIYFNREINSKKPSTIRNKKTVCPFCDHSQIQNILEVEDDIMLIENKFSTLKDALMLVVIETDQCESDMHEYSIEKLTKLMTFAISKWKQYEDSGEYKSVALFKNKGLHSSGTLSHPHMQIVAFKDQDCHSGFGLENLQGHEVNIDGMEFNLSTLPQVSFLEYNIKFDNNMIKLSRTLSLLLNYIEANYWGDSASYNLFFYNKAGDRYVKIIPRYPTSAIKIGYNVTQIYDEKLLTSYEQSIRDFAQSRK